MPGTCGKHQGSNSEQKYIQTQIISSVKIDCNFYKYCTEYYDKFNLTCQRSDTWTKIWRMNRRHLDEVKKKRTSWTKGCIITLHFPRKLGAFKDTDNFQDRISKWLGNSSNKIQLNEKCIVDVVREGRDQN